MYNPISKSDHLSIHPLPPQRSLPRSNRITLEQTQSIMKVFLIIFTLALCFSYINLAQSASIPLPSSKEMLIKRSIKFVKNSERFSISANKVQASIYSGAAKLSNAIGAHSISGKLEKVASNREVKAQLIRNTISQRVQSSFTGF